MKDEEATKAKAESCRIGKSCEARFWCGFCVALIDIKGKGHAAWTERFDHIDNHFMGKCGNPERRIRDWIPVDSVKPRGDVEKAPRQDDSSGKESPENGSPEKDSPDSVASDQSAADSSNGGSHEAVAPRASPEKLATVNPQDREDHSSGKRRRDGSRESEEEPRSVKRARSSDTVVFCVRHPIHHSYLQY